MFSFFRKKSPPISLEQQIQALAECGVTLSPNATLEDLFSFHSRTVYEASPYKDLIPVLGTEYERDDFGPMCHRLWMCDYEQIEGQGAYSQIIDRLHDMSERSLFISNVTDYFNFEANIAWVEFDLDNSRLHWDLKVDQDWLDLNIFVKFDNLLVRHGSAFRLYFNHIDFGQNGFIACFTEAEFVKFQTLATFKLREIG